MNFGNELNEKYLLKRTELNLIFLISELKLEVNEFVNLMATYIRFLHSFSISKNLFLSPTIFLFRENIIYKNVAMFDIILKEILCGF